MKKTWTYHMHGIAVLLALSALLAFTPAFAEEAREPFQFREDFKKVWPTGSSARPKPWTEDEKEIVRSRFRTVKELAPGLIQRVTAYRPLLFYRITTGFKSTNIAQAIESHNGIFFTDNFFVASDTFDYELVTLVHELAHLSDASYRVQTSKEWKDLVQPRADRLRQLFRDKGTPLEGGDLMALKKQHPKLHSTVGLPSLYAAVNLSEALAEYVTHDILRLERAPDEIREFVRDRILSVPYRPEKGLQYFHEAASLHVQGRLKESVDAYTRALEASPDFVQVYLFRAYALEDKGDHGEAVADFLRAIEFFRIEPFEDSIPVLIWENVRKIDDTENVVAEIKRVIQRYPETPAYRFLLADVWELRGHYSRAEEVYTAIIQLDPQNMEAYMGRAHARKKRNACKEAMADYDVLFKSGTNVYTARGECRAALKDFKGAIEDYTAAMGGLPYPSPDILFLRGIAYIGAGEYGKGIEDMKKARRYPGWPARTDPWIQKAEEALGGGGK